MASTPTTQAVTFTVPENWPEGTIELSDGVMCIGGYGDPVGNHRFTSKERGRAPNFTAIQQSAVFGRVPAVVIDVATSPDGIGEIKNEELRIKNDESWFDLSGRRVSQPAKAGIYVRKSNNSITTFLINH